jgi:PPOX class probable F420-dependent enzyme
VAIRLSPDEAWGVIEGSHTGILTTLRADGSPVTLPSWFVVLDRTICMSTPSQTKKVRRIRRDPRASFLVESGLRWAELRAVHVSGRIEIVEDEATKIRISDALDDKYASFRTAQAEMPEATRDHYASRTFLQLLPGPKMLTWDNSQISLAQPR